MNFSFDPSFDAQLVPHPNEWPVFDTIVLGSPPSSSSPSASPSPSIQTGPLPSPTDLATMPIPPSRASPRNKNPDHIPRPRNAFMLFRSAFAASQKITANIEHDNRHITRIIAHCWNCLSDTDKQIWRDKAAVEKAQHAERYPNYRFSPIGRMKKPKKRQVRRNGVEDVKRCETVARLVMAGKSGPALESAMNNIQRDCGSTQVPAGTELIVFASDESIACDASPQDSRAGAVLPFCTPLLPPTTQSMQEPQALVPMLEPPTFGSPMDTDKPEDDLQSLFHSPAPYPYYPSVLPNGVPSPASLPPSHYPSVMSFVQGTELGQSTPDFSLFPWNQSDSFPYYS